MFVICELFFLVVVTTNCVLKERCENIQEHSRTHRAHGWSWKGFVKNEVKSKSSLNFNWIFWKLTTFYFICDVRSKKALLFTKKISTRFFFGALGHGAERAPGAPVWRRHFWQSVWQNDKWSFKNLVLRLCWNNLCFCSFHVEKFVFGTNVLVLLFFYKCLVDRYILWLKCFVAKQKRFFLFCFSRCEWPPSAAVPGSHLSHLSHLSNGETSERKNEKTRERDMRKIGKQRHQMEGAKGNKSATNINTHIEWTHPQRHQRKSRKNMKKKQNFVRFCFPKFRCYHPKNPSLIKRNMNKKMEWVKKNLHL